MTFSQVTALVVNNIFLIAAGGLLAGWLGYRLWVKVERLMNTIDSWPKLAFWAVKLIIIVGMLFKVGGWIYSGVNSAVVAAVNSPSVQTAGQSMVQLGSGLDSLVGWTPSSGGISTDMLQSVSLPSVSEISLISPAAGAIATDIQAAMSNVLPTVEVAPVVAPAAPVVQDVPVQTAGAYVVQRGDSLAKIALAIYGDSNKWPLLCGANQGVLGGNCNSIRSGMKLEIPAAGASVKPMVAPNQPSPGWGQNLVLPAPTYGPAPKPAIEPAYDFSQKNFWSQFVSAEK
jgi:hypothetical protein